MQQLFMIRDFSDSLITLDALQIVGPTSQSSAAPAANSNPNTPGGKSMMELEISPNQRPDMSENMLYQLQMIFASLRYSHRQYYDPRGFCQSF